MRGKRQLMKSNQIISMCSLYYQQGKGIKQIIRGHETGIWYTKGYRQSYSLQVKNVSLNFLAFHFLFPI